MFHRASGLKYESVKQMMEEGVKSSDIFEPFPSRNFGTELEKMSEEDRFPYMSDGIAIYNEIRAYVVAWLKRAKAEKKEGGDDGDEEGKATAEFYRIVQESTKHQKYKLPPLANSDDDSKDGGPKALVDLLAQFIFISTAYHELVGVVVDYVQKPSFVSLRIPEGKCSSDLQSYLITCCIAAFTAIRTPALMNDFPHYFGASAAPPWEKEIWGGFQEKLKALDERLKAANKCQNNGSGKRKYPFKSFEPSRLECSVSV
mmetsp:Transcript_37286/g.59895  ORF Transcript_37286/g.59895 Transcript_37286/m.59895 type:complete len:258 (+) Transcript_37286:1459-2232(+)